MRPARGRPVLPAIALAAVLLLEKSARASDPDRVEWSKDWPRVRVAEVVDVAALTVGSYLISAEWPPAPIRLRGGVLFDNWARDKLRGRTYSAQSTASDVADLLYKGGVLAPYIVDVYFVALGIHQSADVAVPMLLLHLPPLPLSRVTTLAPA